MISLICVISLYLFIEDVFEKEVLYLSPSTQGSHEMTWLSLTSQERRSRLDVFLRDGSTMSTFWEREVEDRSEWKLLGGDSEVV